MDNAYPLIEDGRRADHKGVDLGQPQVIVMPKADSAAVARVKDFLSWSIFNLVYFNVCCMGLVATTFSIKSRDRKYLNDLQGATEYGRKAKIFNIICLILGIIFTVAFIILYTTVFIQLQTAQRNHDVSTHG